MEDVGVGLIVVELSLLKPGCRDMCPRIGHVSALTGLSSRCSCRYVTISALGSMTLYDEECSMGWWF